MAAQNFPGVAQGFLRPQKPILTAAEATEWLGFNSVNALLRARKRGLLPIEMFQLPGRRGWFAATEAVVGWAQACTRNYLSYKSDRSPEDIKGDRELMK